MFSCRIIYITGKWLLAFLILVFLVCVIHRFDERDGCTELGPPIVIFALQLVSNERIYVLNGRQ